MSQARFTERIIRPEDCALGFGIPTTEDAFLKARRDPRREFARKFCALGQYRAKILRPVELNRPRLIALGAHVVEGMTSDAFGSLFGAGFNVVILFSHWKANGVELADGLIAIPELVDRVPADFVGVVDLCVCHPEKFTTALRAERPRCLVRYTEKPATPALWLSFYFFLFHQLKHRSLTYLEALDTTIAQFRMSCHGRTS